MTPTRTTRSSSRRSSILKPPKPRQPLQNLNFTNPSNESSPLTTTKFKRRVSFAEKKHVKEFCNSLEQGTVWDSTYEEHDLSNLKVLCTSNKECYVERTCTENIANTIDHCNDLVSVNPESVDKYTIRKTNTCFIPDEINQENLIAIDRETVRRNASVETELISTKKELLPDSSSRSFQSTARKTNESVFPLDLPTNSESYLRTTFPVFEDPDVNKSSKVAVGQDPNVNNFKSTTRNVTSVTNMHMDFTEAVPTSMQFLKHMKSDQQDIGSLEGKCYESIIPYVGLQPYQENTDNLNNVSMEMTMAILNRPYIVQEKVVHMEHTQNFNNISMEMTAAVPTRPYNDQEKETYTEGTKNFNDVSMEMTAAVPSRPYNFQHNETDTERIKNFKDMSMEMTAAVPTRPYNVLEKETYTERTKNFNDVSMEMTAAVPSRPYNFQHNETRTEHTKHFKDVSMEMTAAVPTRPYHFQRNETDTERIKNFKDMSMEMTAAVPTRPYNVLDKETYTERTKNFNDVSMEMTAAVPSRPYNFQCNETRTEHTKNFKDMSMEMTAAIPSRPYHFQRNETDIERTKNFKDISMEMTAAVLSRPYNFQHNETHTERTKNFKDVSMEMTAAVPSRPYNFQHNETHTECTKNFNDFSMEMTAAVPTRSYNFQRNETDTERTKNFKDVAMEMTAAVPSRPYNLQHNETRTERTKNFKDVSMEMTAAVPSRPYNFQHNETHTECTKNFNDFSMEMTAAVPTRSYNFQRNETDTERTKNFKDVAMEMTAAVPSRPYNFQHNETHTECTKNFKDMSMEMTAAVPTRSYNFQRNETDTERTKNFKDISMEMTAAVPTRSYNFQHNEIQTERTKNFKDVAMEMTVAVPTRTYNVLEKETYTERTKNFNDVSMEMTAAVPSRPYNFQHNETHTECTKNFNDFSMEMTAAVPSRPYNFQHNETHTECTKNFKDMSMEMTAAVPTRSYNFQCSETDTERTKNFKDISMEMTAAVPSRPYNFQHNETHTECTKNFKDVSMEMTAAVPSRPYNLQENETYTDRTKKFNDLSMKMTAAVPTRPYILQEKETYTEHTKKFNDASMKMTAIPAELSTLQDEGAYAEQTNNFRDISMEMTAAVPIKLYDLQGKRHNIDKMAGFVPDVSTDLSEAVAINVYADRIQPDKIHKGIPSSMEAIQQNANDATCTNDKIMEITKAVDKNDFANVRCTVNSHTTESFGKTAIYEDKGLEVTTTVSTILKTQSDNSDVQSDRTRIVHNDLMTTTVTVSCINNTGTAFHIQSENVNVESDKTRIFHDNSMAISAVVSPLNKMDVSEENVKDHKSNINAQDSYKAVSYPNLSMEITEAVTPLESIPQQENANTSTSEITQTRLPEKIEHSSSPQNSLNRTDIRDNVLRDITASVVLPLLNSSESSEERNCTMNYAEISEVKIVEEPSPNKVPSLVNIEANTALHDSPLQDICASALNKDNTGEACATSNSASNDSLHTVTPDVHQGECLLRSKDIVPHPQRAYSIKPLSTNLSFTDNINEYNQSIETNAQDTSSCQAQAFFEKSCTLFNKSLEELEEVKPPSFLCLDESVEDVPVNINYRQNTASSILTVQDFCEKTTNNLLGTVAYNVISPPRDKGTQNNSNIENENMEQSVLVRDDIAEEKCLQSDQVKLHSDQNTSNNTMEIEMQEIDPQTSLIEKDVSIELDPFSSLIKELRLCAQSDEIIWEVYHENIEKKMFIVGFMCCSLLIVVYLGDDCDILGDQSIKDIKIISRLADDADNLISMVHRIILEKINVRKLIDLYKSVEDITLMLDYLSMEVELAMNFMFELKRLDDLSLLDITRDSVSFVSRTKKMDIILRVTVIIKPFETIDSQDISVHCILGCVRDEEIKMLIKNIKKDHKFLRRFMKDVQDYIYLMEEAVFATKVPY